MPERLAYVFQADLDGYRGVSRTLALASNQTLELLHTLLQAGFGWDDDHLYSFWLDGRYWGDQETEYTRPDADYEETGAKSAKIPLKDLRLRPGREIAYVFDFGDEWRVRLRVSEVRPAGDEAYPQVLESKGQAPPQYPEPDEE